MNIIFQINGGMGKCIAATAVCEAIKTEYPSDTLIVVSGYPDVFLNNPNVDRTFGFNNFSYFYEDYIENKEFVVFAHDPYLETAHLRQNEHLINTWCNMFGIAYNGEKPKIFLSDRELKYYGNKFSFEKPIFVIQTNGGASTDMKYSWARDIPMVVANKVVEEFKNEYSIVHIKREDQLQIPSTIPITDNFRALSVLILMSKKRLFLDSFTQHTAAALNIPSTVCWITNKPEVFGYQIHDNIRANPFTVKPELKGSYLNKYNILGDLLEFSYNNELEIFDVNKIIESIKRQ
jgi:hypothetical protein